MTNETTGWKIAGSFLSSEVSETAQPIFKQTFLMISISFVIGAIVIFIIIKSIIHPIRNLKEQATQISEGNLTESIQVVTNDEIGK